MKCSGMYIHIGNKIEFRLDDLLQYSALFDGFRVSHSAYSFISKKQIMLYYNRI